MVGLLRVVGVASVPVLIFAAIGHAPELLTRAGAACRRWHLFGPTPPPLGPSLEKLAADLRRLYPLAHFPQPGVRIAKYRGILQAYDEHLVSIAQVLEVPTSLTDLHENSFEREAERLRVEHALIRAGLVWT